MSDWAYALDNSPIRATPSGAIVAHLRLTTEHGNPDVYRVLSQEHGWVRIRVPSRPNGATGWVPRRRLGTIHTVTTRLTIDRANLRATLTRNNRRIWSSRIGIGAPSTPTPHGHFIVRERLRNLNGDPLYGPYAFGTSALARGLSDWPRGGVIGIHGTNQPGLIPGRPSHGCIRVPNAKITELARVMPVGTPIRIR